MLSPVTGSSGGSSARVRGPKGRNSRSRTSWESVPEVMVTIFGREPAYAVSIVVPLGASVAASLPPASYVYAIS
jgi:hypothetical protein